MSSASSCTARINWLAGKECVCVCLAAGGSVKGCATVAWVGGRGAFPSVRWSCVQRLHSLHHSRGLQQASHDTKPTRNSRNVFPVVLGYHAHTQSADHRPVCAAASTVAYCTFVVCTESVLLALPLSSHAGPFKSAHSWPSGQDSNLNADSKYTSCSWAPAAGIQW